MKKNTFVNKYKSDIVSLSVIAVMVNLNVKYFLGCLYSYEILLLWTQKIVSLASNEIFKN